MDDDTRTRQLARVSMGSAALACTGLSPSTTLGHGVALVVIALAAILIVAACRTRLRRLGRSDVPLVWTALPLVEAALVARLTLHGEPVTSGVAAAFAVWGATGCVMMFRRRPGEDVTEVDAISIDKTILRGSELK